MLEKGKLTDRWIAVVGLAAAVSTTSFFSTTCRDYIRRGDTLRGVLKGLSSRSRPTRAALKELVRATDDLTRPDLSFLLFTNSLCYLTYDTDYVLRRREY